MNLMADRRTGDQGLTKKSNDNLKMDGQGELCGRGSSSSVS